MPVDDSQPYERFVMTNKYKIIEDLKFREWEWIQLRVAPLNDHEINMIS